MNKGVILILFLALAIAFITSSDASPRAKRQMPGFGMGGGRGYPDRWSQTGGYNPSIDHQWGHYGEERRYHRCMRGCLREEGLRHERRCIRMCEAMQDDDD